jgi:hypothetical protein
MNPFNPFADHQHAATDVVCGLLNGNFLPDMSQTVKGGVPATGVPSGKFLRDDGTWAAGGSGSGYSYFPSGW